MKTLVRTTLAGMVLLFAAAGPLAGQQGPQIVYLNADSIYRVAPGAQQARERLQREMVELEAEAETALAPLQADLQRQIQEFQQQERMMPEARREERRGELQELSRQYAAATASFERRAAVRQNEIMGPIVNRIDQTIQQLRQERGYALILNAAAAGVVSADPSLDVTDEVIRRLTAQANRE